MKCYWLVEQRVAGSVEWAVGSWGRVPPSEQQTCTGSSNTWPRAAVTKGFLAALLRLHACQGRYAPSLYCVWFVFPKVIMLNILHLLQTPLVCTYLPNYQYRAMPWLSRLFPGLSPRYPGFSSGLVFVEFVVDKVVRDRMFFQLHRSSPVFIIPQAP